MARLDERLNRQAAAGQPGVKRVALEQLRDHIRGAVMEADIEDSHDVRMIQRGGGAGLLLEPLEALWCRRDARGQDFDRHVAIETQIVGPVDLAHTACAQRAEDLYGPTRVPGSSVTTDASGLYSPLLTRVVCVVEVGVRLRKRRRAFREVGERLNPIFECAYPS